MNWLAIGKQAFKMLPVIVFIVIGFHYAYTIKQNNKLKESVLVLEQNVNQQRIVLDTIEKRTEEQEKAVSDLTLQLGEKQATDSSKIRKMLSYPAPKSCVDSITYLKQQAFGITFN